jgi:DNA-binding SARP family transcriptional activator
VTGIDARWTPIEPLRPAVHIRLFGGFRLEVDGAPRDLAALKPRVRMLLRLLALQGGRPLHREAIQVALWPEAPPDSAARNLHVAVSSLRQALEPGVARGGSSLVVRDGDAYRLAVGPDVGVDLVTFEEELAAAGRARAAGDLGAAMRGFESALARMTGDLLPEDGAAEWVVEPRERVRSEGVEAAQRLADLRLAGGDPEGAARAAAAGLRVDRYHDPLWRLLVDARERAGDPIAASRARAEHARVLAELGLAPASTDYTSRRHGR